MSNVQQIRAFVLPWKDSDDEVVVNVAIGSLRESLLAWLKTERGVHIETLLCSIGALAGGRSEDRAAGNAGSAKFGHGATGRASCQIIGLLYSVTRPQSCQCTPAQAGLVPVSPFASNAPANRRAV
ncbi:MAG TPA: hypothetical protein VGL45_19385 [Bradyrhizobium sp.]